MSAEFLSRIFDPFSQEKTDARSVYQGTGLGMAIARGLIEQMHGSIEVTSQVGVGSVFVITIPFEIAEKQKKDEEIAEKYNIRGLHLLAAEDNELNAEIIDVYKRQAVVWLASSTTPNAFFSFLFMTTISSARFIRRRESRIADPT